MERLPALNIFFRTPNPRTVTKFRSTKEEWLNGAQGVSKLGHQESSMPPE